MTNRWPSFCDEEFRKALPSCSLSQMDPFFMDRLQAARDLAGVPFVINSAYRTPEWDLSKGRSGRSYHCSGRAVDIRCCNSVNRWEILRALFAAGFHGIGIAGTFIHVDDRPNQTVWLYD